MINRKYQFNRKKYAGNSVMSEELCTFAGTIHNNNAPMTLRHIFLFLLLAVVLPTHGQDTAGSDIVSRTFLSADETKAIEQRVYDNGLGDIVQEVQSYPGSTLPSVIVRHEYDEYRRKTKTWLPVTSSGCDFISSNRIASLAQSQYDSDSAPFSRTVYDGFLPSQPAAQYKAGAQWQNNDKKVSVTYSEYVGTGMFLDFYNDDEDQEGEEEDIYTLPNIKYLCTRTVDEDGCPQAEYTDLNGRLMITETSQGRTYYLYDLKGDIRYVIPPALSAYILSHYEEDIDIPNSDEMIQKYAYIYRYDKQRHCIYKKLPGCDPVYYIYDRAGNCILTQDGEQRKRGEWAYSIPDKFGRPCISGICKYAGVYSSEPLHSVHVYAEYNGTSTKTGGYAVHNFALSEQKLYTAAYYDSYSFIGHHGVPSSLTASTVSGFPIDNTLGHGLQTGSATAVLSDGVVTGYVYSAMYYDSHYRVAQVKSTNHFGGTETTSTSYTYTGKPENVRIQHASTKTGTLVQNCTYTYDGADRMSSRTLSITNGVPALTCTMQYEYDALGRLTKTTRPLTSGASPDVSYEYDLHGWTTKITTNRFQEELFYADGPGTPCWNGDISAMRWQEGKRGRKRGYKFLYDNAGRLTQAIYGEQDALTSNVDRFSERVGYDAHGNITRIQRQGKISANSYGLMDNLTLSYDGNQLTGVSEAAADYNATGTFEYKKANGSEYLYDANGNLIADRSRRIAYITYDSNNNPSCIYFTNGYMTRYTYSATGQKLTVEHFVALPNITWAFGVKPNTANHQAIFAGHTDYLLGGSLIVKEDKTDRLLFDGGYAKAERIGDTTYGYTLFFYNQDHLGNIREVVNASGSLQQRTNYYPFGAPYADPDMVTNVSLQPYKYNGKELDLMHGLNTYDYGARQYDPILAKWDRVDPLAEKYYPLSPYVYCKDNPINSIDPDGRNSIKILLKGAYKLGKSVAKNGLSSLSKGATYASAFNDVVEDAKTVFDSNASVLDRTMAGLSLLSEAISPVSIKDGKTLGNVLGIHHRIIPNGGKSKPHGGKMHNDAIDNKISEIKKNGNNSNIRKNQKQVDSGGNTVGNNRPDIQYDDENGIHHNVEFDNSPKQSGNHKETISKNDPNSINEFFLLLNSNKK